MLSACSASTTPGVDKAPGGQTTRMAGPDAGVAALLPKGPHTFTAEYELNEMGASITGYVDFDDCTTDATATYRNAEGTGTVAYRNAGTGEAFSKDGGAWTSTGDPSFDTAGTMLFSPILIANFSVPAANAIVCSLNLLAQYASLPATADAGAMSTDLVWDHDRISAYNERERLAWGEAFYRAAGATDSDIAKLSSAGVLRATFVFDVPNTNTLGRITPRVTRSGEVITIELSTTTASGKKYTLTYRFTPTAKRTVEPVEFTTYLDAIRAEAEATGKSFEEILAASVGQ